MNDQVSQPIKRIEVIKNFPPYYNYKSSDYGDERNDFTNINLFYGENGAGKSSLTSLFKHCLGLEVSDKTKQKLEQSTYRLLLSDGTNICDNEQIPQIKHSLLVFDTDFINNNIHSNGSRSNQKNQHAQNSGKLLISLDTKAISLRSEKDQLQDKLEEEKQRLKTFGFCDQNLEHEYSITCAQDLEINIIHTSNQLLQNLKDLEKQRQHTDNITKISPFPKLANLDIIKIEELLNKLKNIEQSLNTYKSTDETIQSLISKNRNFYEQGVNLYTDHTLDTCPLCNSKLTAPNQLLTLLDVLNTDYVSSKKNLEDIQNKVKDTESEYSKFLQQIPTYIHELYNKLRTYNTDYGIDVSHISKESFHTSQAKIFVNYNIDLKNNESIVKANQQINDLNKFIDSCNTTIKEKQEQLDDPQILQNKQTSIKNQIAQQEKYNFIKQNKIRLKEYYNLKKNNIETKRQSKEKEIEYNNYITSNLQDNYIDDINIYIEQLGLAFKLTATTNSAPNVKEYPISFEIIDKNTNKPRLLANDISEGERQLISLAYFLALVQRTQNPIVIFDDPITSLDTGNLQRIAQLINNCYSEQQWTQLFILTHHLIFWNYLILSKKNKIKQFEVHNYTGSSFFIHKQNSTYLIHTNSIKDLEEDLRQSLSSSMVFIKYGGWLRYSVELLIQKKYKLESLSLSHIIKQLQDNPLQNKLTQLQNIYDFCNKNSASHSNLGNDSYSISGLREQITQFVNISQNI